MVRASHVAVALAVTLFVTAACSTVDKTTDEQSRTYDSYVAMGDSSVSGPGISPMDPAAARCSRSLKNWPSLLAESLGDVEFTDVSCGGAVSDDIYKARPAATALQPHAQLKAVTKDTDLVTITIGGNDEGFYSKITFACLAGALASESQCRSFVGTKLQPILRRTTDRVASTLESIRVTAPSAKVVLVGYLRMLPAEGSCTVPGLSKTRNDLAVAAWIGLDKAMEVAAKRAEVDYLSMSEPSMGHTVCAGESAWMNGLTPKAGDGAFLHPNAAGMRAVAAAVNQHLAGPN